MRVGTDWGWASGGFGEDGLGDSLRARRLAVPEVLLEQGRDQVLHVRHEVVELLDALPLGRRQVGDDADPVGGDELEPAVDRGRAGDQRGDGARRNAEVLAAVPPAARAADEAGRLERTGGAADRPAARAEHLR